MSGVPRPHATPKPAAGGRTTRKTEAETEAPDAHGRRWGYEHGLLQAPQGEARTSPNGPWCSPWEIFRAGVCSLSGAGAATRAPACTRHCLAPRPLGRRHASHCRLFAPPTHPRCFCVREPPVWGRGLFLRLPEFPLPERVVLHLVFDSGRHNFAALHIKGA